MISRASHGQDRVKRKRTRNDVVMPLDPPYSVLRWLAGDPVILAASDELACRELYDLIREALAKRKRK